MKSQSIPLCNSTFPPTSHKLIIAEKPSVAQTIAAALGIKGKKDGYIEGGGYLISWCVGHLVQLAEAAAYGEQYKKCITALFRIE